jgi:hypothetical protein
MIQSLKDVDFQSDDPERRNSTPTLNYNFHVRPQAIVVTYKVPKNIFVVSIICAAKTCRTDRTEFQVSPC